MKENVVRVLLVDDSSTICTALKSKLKKYSGDEFEVSTAVSLREGLEKVRDISPEVILLDLQLPDSEGIETLRSMRHAVPEVPIIVLSAYDGKEYLMQAFESGAYDYLVKAAVQGFDIAKSIRSTLTRRREEEQLRLMVEQSVQGIAILQDDRVVTANPEVLRITGFSAAEFLGMRRQTLISLAHPDDCPQVMEHIENRMNGRLTSAVYTFRFKRKDGVSRWLEVRDKKITYREQPALLMSLVDVTDSVKEKHARAHLAAIVDGSSDAIMSKSLDGVILSWNRAAEKMYGYSHRQAVGQSVELVVPPEKSDEGRWIIDTVKKGELVENLQTTRLHKDGHRLVVSLSASPIYDPENGIDGISVISRDITEERRVRDRLELQAHVLDMVKDTVFVHDVDGNMLYVNEEACVAHGYSREELLGKKLWDVLAPEHVEIIPERKSMLLRNRGGCFEVVHIRKDGTRFPLEVRTRVSDIGGSTMVISIARDVTERLEADKKINEEKQRLATTLRSIGDGVITTDIDGNVLLMNRAAEELSGVSAKQSRGMRCTELLRLVREKDAAPWDDLFLTARVEPVQPDEPLILRSSGRPEQKLIVSIAPLRSEGKPAWGLVVVVRDITEQLRAQREIIRAQKLESLGVLAGGIAHDFNNILLTIWGNLSLIKQEVGENPSVYRRLERIEKASENARGLTEQFRTFSRGGTPVRIVASLAPILKENAEFSVRGLTAVCAFRIPEDLHPVNVDEGQFRQVITNLTLNAAQSMPRGGTITIAAENTTVGADDLLPVSPGAYVHVSVEDQGGGIDDESIGKIFDPYFTTKQGGSGLGLSSAYSIIRAHDGYMTVDTEIGIGSVFHLYLPAVKEGKLNARRHNLEDVELERGYGKILVMDDEPSVRETVEDMLALAGYEPLCAVDGAEAIRLYRQSMDRGEPCRAVILDLTVPGAMGGCEAVKQLRLIDTNLKAIVSSGYSNDRVMAEYRREGFDAVITKPYSVKSLAHTLHGLLNGKKE